MYPSSQEFGNSPHRLDSDSQNERFRLLPDLNRFLLTHPDVRQAFPRICQRLQRAIPHQHAELALYEKKSDVLRLFAEHRLTGTPLPADFSLALDKTPHGEAVRSRLPVLVEDLSGTISRGSYTRRTE